MVEKYRSYLRGLTDDRDYEEQDPLEKQIAFSATPFEDNLVTLGVRRYWKVATREMFTYLGKEYEIVEAVRETYDWGTKKWVKN